MGVEGDDTPLPVEIVDALETWAARHPHPDDPIWRTSTGSYTPRSFTHAATHDPTSPAGSYLRRSLASGLTLEEIIDALK